MRGRNSMIRSLIMTTTALILFLHLLPSQTWGQGGNDVRDQVSAQAAAVDWETRQGYELTHLNTWGDFRPSVQRAIAGYEAHERGITEVIHLPNEPSVEEGGYVYLPVLVTVDEANQIIQTIINNRYEHVEDGVTYYWLPWDENGYGYGDGWSGASATHHTGVGLAYVLAKYRHLIPDDLERDLNETVAKLDWFGDESLHPYMSYSNIPVAGACGMLLAGDYVQPDPERGITEEYIADLRARGYAWFDRMYEEVKRYGYYEILSSYTGVQHVSLPAVYEMAKDPSTRQKARFLLDELYLHLAHLYQPGSTSGTGYEPGGNLAGFHDRCYDPTVTGRPNAHLMWLLTGDPGGEVFVNWWPYSILVASGYQPPEFVVGIALKEKGIAYQAEQTFWTSGTQATLAFKPQLPDLPEWAGTSDNRHMLVPHHTYITADGSLALGGTISHILSSRAGSHNLRLSFSTMHPPLAISQQDPEKASDDPDFPLRFAFQYEEPSFHRLFHDNVVLSIWDPMPDGFDYTTTFIPIEAADQVEHRGRWFFIRQGDAFAAYAVLADPQEGVSVEVKDGFGKGSKRYEGQFYYVTTPGGALAAGVGEIASASDYGSFESFMSDIEGRSLAFDNATGRLSYVTRGGETLVVQYDPEQYEIGGQVKHREDFAPQYFIKSPWAEHRIPSSEDDEFITEVNWDGTTWLYNWKTLEINTFSSLDNSVQPPGADQGEVITYTLRLRGNGQAITMTDSLPLGLSDPLALTATEGTVTYNAQSRRVEWEGSPASDTMVEVVIPVSVTTGETQEITNTAALTYTADLVTTATSTFLANPFRAYLPFVLKGIQ